MIIVLYYLFFWIYIIEKLYFFFFKVICVFIFFLDFNNKKKYSMKIISNFFIRFLCGFALVVCWTIICVTLGFGRNGEVSALMAWGNIGVFSLGFWLSKKWLDRRHTDKI